MKLMFVLVLVAFVMACVGEFPQTHRPPVCPPASTWCR
jgi:hypothetical protein